MATVADRPAAGRPIDHLCGTPRAHGLDRWIFVITAALYIVVTLIGFIPDSLMKIELVRTGQRAPFPPLLHVHAVVMGSFLLLFFAQTYWVASGRQALHERLGPWLASLAALLVVVGFALAPTMYHQVWDALQAATGDVRDRLADINHRQDNILLLQIRIGLLFPLFIFLGIRARNIDSGFHKRMMMIAPAMAMPASIDRITWIPHTLPASPLSASLYTLVILAPMIAWDVIRNKRVHRAYWIFLAVYIPSMIILEMLWDTPGWHQTAHRIMGV